MFFFGSKERVERGKREVLTVGWVVEEICWFSFLGYSFVLVGGFRVLFVGLRSIVFVNNFEVFGSFLGGVCLAGK